MSIVRAPPTLRGLVRTCRSFRAVRLGPGAERLSETTLKHRRGPSVYSEAAIGAPTKTTGRSTVKRARFLISL
jgi:hypothetical protein